MKLITNSNNDKTIQDELSLMIDTTRTINILSPYLTWSKVINKIKLNREVKLQLVVDIGHDSHLEKSAVDISLLGELIDQGHTIKMKSKLHSKLYITDNAVMLGSANFTMSGLSNNLESAILFEKENNVSLFNECCEYFEEVFKASTRLKRKDIEKLKQINSAELGEKERLERLEIFIEGSKQESASLIEQYDSEYDYPKSLEELKKGTKFYFIDYKVTETNFRERFPTKHRKELFHKRVEFVREELFVKNQGYNMITNIERKSSKLCRWVKLNRKYFNFELKEHQDFLTDRHKYFLEEYRKKYSIEPKTGYFSRAFKHLHDKGLTRDNFFEVTYADFQKRISFERLESKLIEMDSFIKEHNRIPDTYARLKLQNKKKQGDVSLDVIQQLRYEGSLGDILYTLKKKLDKKLFKYDEEQKIVQQKFKEWESR